MSAFTGQFVVTVWILWGLVLRSDARVLIKPCTGGEFVAAVNSSRLFGLPVACHDACEVLAYSRDSVAACRRGMHETTGWTLCRDASTPEALLLQDRDKHLCLLFTTRQHVTQRPCSVISVDSSGCHDIKDNHLRQRRSAVIDDTEGSAGSSQHGHSVAIIVSSAIGVFLLVLVSFLCVGSNKDTTTSASSKAPVNAAQEDSTQNATPVSQANNHHDSANQTTVVNQNQGGSNEENRKAEADDPSQHLYQNVNVQIEARPESGHSEGVQLADQNQDHQPGNQDQDQLVVQLVANQNEELGDQNEEPQEVDPNEAQANAQDHQAQQPADQNQDQEAANGNQQQDPEKAKIPYGVVTIHSDQSNAAADNNYAEVRNEDESIQDIMYDSVNDDGAVNENGYSTVVRDKPIQQQPRRDRMYESVDEAFDRETKPSEPAVNGSEDMLEQDDTYEQVPDTFRQKVASFSHQSEAPKLPPMHTRTRKPSDDPAHVQHRASSSATLPSVVAPSSPLMRARLYSTPAIKSPPGKTPPPPSFPAPAAPPPTYPAPNPPSEYDDDDDTNALYARPEPMGGSRCMSSPQLRDKINLEERKKASTLPVKATLSHGGPRSPAGLGPLPELPNTSDELGQEEQEDEEPGYDSTEAVMARQDHDHLESDKAQEDEQVVQDHQEQQPSSPQRTSSMVKRDGKGYALPSTKRTSASDNCYAVVNVTQKRLSQKKKKDMGGAKRDADVAKSQSPPPLSPPPSSPPPLDPELVDEDLKVEPSVPPRLPQSEELVEPEKNEPPYAKVNKKKVSESDQPLATTEIPSTTGETGDDDEIDPYAAVDLVILGNTAPEVQVRPSDREYETIDNVMSSPTDRNPVNVTLSELEGDYACVRSDATIPVSQRQDPQPVAVTTAVHNSQTPVDTAAHGETRNTENTTTRLSSPEELTEL